MDIDPERAERAAAEFGAVAVRSLAELAEHCDVAIVAVPTSAHAETGIECLERGLDVLLEKPIAGTLAEARALASAAARTSRRLAVGHVERFNPVFRTLGPHVSAPLFVEAHRLAPFVPRSVDVDVVLDLMIHDVDLLLSVVPPSVSVERVDASGVPVLTAREDIANARITFTNGLVANLTASRVSRERLRRIRFFSAARVYVALDLLGRTGETVRLAADPREWLARGEMPPLGNLLEETRVGPFPDANPLADELGDFLGACETGAPVSVDASAATRALEIALEVRSQVAAGLRRVAAGSV